MARALSACASQSRRIRSAAPSSFSVITVFVWARKVKLPRGPAARSTARTGSPPMQPQSENAEAAAKARAGARTSARILRQTSYRTGCGLRSFRARWQAARLLPAPVLRPKPPGRTLCRDRRSRQETRVSYKDILVVLDAAEDSQGRLDVAAALAKRCGAHLVVLYPVPHPELHSDAGYMGLLMLQSRDRQWRDRVQDQADTWREAFEWVTRQHGLSAEWRE